MTVRLPIANFKTGMNTYIQPEFLPDDGFVDIENAVAYRGVIRRRDGFESLIMPQADTSLLVSAITNANPGKVTTTTNHGLTSGQQVTIIGVQGMTQIGNQQTISAIIFGPVTQITTSGAHGYYTGQQILINGIAASVSNFINSTIPYTITVIDGTNFTIPLYTVNSSETPTGGLCTAMNPYTVTVTAVNQFTIGVDTTAFGVYTGGGTVNSIPFMGYLAITGVTSANPAQITTAVNHNLTTGQQVQIGNVIGVVSSPTPNLSNAVNNNTFAGPLQPFIATVTGATTFTIPVDTTGTTAYSRSGTVFEPVMGLFEAYPGAAEFFPKLIAFNETQAFVYDETTEDFDNISGGTTWTGTDSQFFSAANYQGSFWATNNFDPIRYYISGTTWTNFQPVFDAAGDFVNTALLIFPYKDRLVLLNTNENVASANIAFPQRARWSQNGTTYVGAPTPTGFGSDATAWRQDIVGKGGFIDAPTSEQIVGAGFVRDTLVVMFTRSAWRLRYRGDPQLPFVWERIDSTYGSNSTWSSVIFDTGLMSVGKYGTTLTTVNACERIDYQIPDQIFQIQQLNNGNLRVNGIRDYQRQLVYWLYPDSAFGASETLEAYYPNRALVYNYIEQGWSLYNMQFTFWGYYRRPLNDAATWGHTFEQWQEDEAPWNSGFQQAENPQVVAGDPFGAVMLFQPDLTDDNGQPINWVVTTKKFNPFVDKGEQCKAIYLYMLVDGNEGGQFTVQHFVDENSDFPTEIFPELYEIPQPTPPTPSAVVFPNPNGLTINTNTSTGQAKVWRRVPLSGTSQYHQFTYTFSTPQLEDPYGVIPFEDYSIYQMILELAPAGRLNYGDDATP